MDGINYDELFGVDSSGNDRGDDAGSGSGNAADGEDTGDNGGKTQDPAADQDTNKGDAEDGSDDGGGADDPKGEGDGTEDSSKHGADEKSKLTPEERSRNAARRRKAEIDEAITKARQEEQEKEKGKWNSFFASANLKNPLDGNKPITNFEEYQAYKEQFDNIQLEKNLKAGKLTPEDLQKVVAETPAVKKAAELLNQTEKREREAEDAATQAKIDEDIKKINALDPSVSKVEDLLKMENAKEFYEYVKRGNTFYDAFYLVNREKLTKVSLAAAKQQVLNNANSKNHLSGTATRGAGAVTVPADELSLYKELNPGLSEAEIQKHYNSYKKK